MRPPSLRMFPSTCSILSRTVTRDPEGGEVEDYTTTRYAGIPCQFGAWTPGWSTDEARDAEALGLQADRRAFLLGDWDIDISDRAVIDGTVYDILGVERDSFATLTGLRIQERAP